MNRKPVVKFNVTGPTALLMNRGPEVFHRHLTAALYEATAIAHGQVASFTPVGANRAAGIRGSLQSEVYTGISEMRGRVWTPLPYAEYVEHGTKPHFPPIEPLEEWGRVILGKSGLGFILARAISIRGTRGYGMFARGEKAAKPHIRQRFAAARRRVEAELS